MSENEVFLAVGWRRAKEKKSFWRWDGEEQRYCKDSAVSRTGAKVTILAVGWRGAKIKNLTAKQRWGREKKYR